MKTVIALKLAIPIAHCPDLKDYYNNGKYSLQIPVIALTAMQDGGAGGECGGDAAAAHQSQEQSRGTAAPAQSSLRSGLVESEPSLLGWSQDQTFWSAAEIKFLIQILTKTLTVLRYEII